MSHLLEVRRTVLHQEIDRAFTKVTKLIRKQSELLKLYKDSNDQDIKATLDALHDELMTAGIEDYTSIVKWSFYADDVGLSLDKDSIDETANMMESYLDYVHDLSSNNKINNNAKLFVEDTVGCSAQDPRHDEFVLMFSKLGYDAAREECCKILNVISKAKDNKLALDDGEEKTSVASCVKTLQDLGVPITQLEFINIINENVWSSDEESYLSSIIKIEE